MVSLCGEGDAGPAGGKYFKSEFTLNGLDNDETGEFLIIGLDRQTFHPAWHNLVANPKQVKNDSIDDIFDGGVEADLMARKGLLELLVKPILIMEATTGSGGRILSLTTACLVL